MTRRAREGRRIHLPYWPGLDGLRALAVLAVLAYHQGFPWAKGGFLGVSLFFTLSGFLITSLLLAEHDATGRIRLRAFWGRRLRRLAPAAMLALGLALVTTVAVVPDRQKLEAIGDIRAALGYVANWRFIVLGAPYADLFRVPSPVQHFWSLAIEEQFYLVFPVVAAVALRTRRLALGIALAAIAVLSFASQLRLGVSDRSYYGTDARAAELAVGGLLALAYPWLAAQRQLWRQRDLSRFGDVAGWTALVATLVLWVKVPLNTEALYSGGFTAIAMMSALLVLGAVSGASLSRVLAIGPLVSIGRISYGLYLFHFPLYMLLSPDRTGLAGVRLFAVRVVATFAAASLSSWLVERPVRERRALRKPTLALAGFASAAALVAVATVSATPGPPGRTRLASVARAVAPAAAVGPAAGSGDSTPLVAHGGQAPLSTGATAPADVTSPPADPVVGRRAPRVVVVGDSTALANGEGMREWGEHSGALDVTYVTELSCPVLVGDVERVRTGFDFKPTAKCRQLIELGAAEARRVDADAVVVFTGYAQLADWRYYGESEFRSILDPTVGSWYVDALSGELRDLEALHVPLLWADVAAPHWDLDQTGLEYGVQYPGTGAVTTNDPARTAALNDITDRVLAGHPATSVVPFAEVLATNGDTRVDGMHLSVAAVGSLMTNGLAEALATAYRTVVSNAGSGVAARAITWAP